MKHTFYLLKTAIVLFVLALAAASAHAVYPERAIHLIVPYPPGGLTDAVARAVAKALSDRVQQPVVVENIAGGGGNIGADKAAKSPADGYTIFIGNNATVGLNTLVYKQLAFDPLADLAPIMLIAESQTVLVVNPALPVKNVAELIALAKSKPGQLNFGSTGTGGLSHLVGELFNSAAGIQMTHIPYKGTGPALTDLLGGQIQVMFNDTSLPHIQSGKLRALAVTGAPPTPRAASVVTDSVPPLTIVAACVLAPLSVSVPAPTFTTVLPARLSVPENVAFVLSLPIVSVPENKVNVEPAGPAIEPMLWL